MAKPYYQIVRETISDNVQKGHLPKGTKLLISSVAERLGVSRPPVRRALELLAEDGVLTALSSQGYVVGKPGAVSPGARTNLHGLDLDLPAELGSNLGQASWERIYETVEREVLNCIPFGTFQLSEVTIGEYFEVSRTVARDVLSRMDARGLIQKDRSSHWIAGPFGARMLDDAHQMRRMIEPGALVLSLPYLARKALSEARDRVAEALARSHAVSQAAIEQIEDDLHVECLKPLRNRRLAEAVRMTQISLVINRLFGTYIGVHDETELLNEHALVLGHLLLGDGGGAEAALRHHLDADHARVRNRLKVLSVFDAAEIAPYLSRVR